MIQSRTNLCEMPTASVSSHPKVKQLMQMFMSIKIIVSHLYTLDVLFCPCMQELFSEQWWDKYCSHLIAVNNMSICFFLKARQDCWCQRSQTLLLLSATPRMRSKQRAKGFVMFSGEEIFISTAAI